MTDDIAKWRAGDSVRVKAGVVDEEFGIDIGGWQGRVLTVDAENQTLLLTWDSITLRNLPDAYVTDCEQKGYSWSKYSLLFPDVEKAQPRDKEADVEEAIDELENKFAWVSLGPEGEQINQILAGIDADDEWEMLERWEAYFGQALTFPFAAEVTEWQDRGPLRGGDKVQVHGITLVDDHYGIIVSVRRGRERYDFPLCDLTPVDETSPNYQPVRNYAIWFANR